MFCPNLVPFSLPFLFTALPFWHTANWHSWNYNQLICFQKLYSLHCHATVRNFFFFFWASKIRNLAHIYSRQLKNIPRRFPCALSTYEFPFPTETFIPSAGTAPSLPACAAALLLPDMRQVAASIVSRWQWTPAGLQWAWHYFLWE